MVVAADTDTQTVCLPMQAEDLYILPMPPVDYDKVAAE